MSVGDSGWHSWSAPHPSRGRGHLISTFDGAAGIFPMLLRGELSWQAQGRVPTSFFASTSLAVLCA